MENVKNVNEKNVNEDLKEMSEERITLITDFSSVIKNIKIVPTVTKYATLYHAVVDVNGMFNFKVKVDESFVNFIKLCDKLKIKPFKCQTVVKEYSSEKDRQFTCVKFITIKNNICRFFIDRVDVESLELVFDQVNLTSKK